MHYVSVNKPPSHKKRKKPSYMPNIGNAGTMNHMSDGSMPPMGEMDTSMPATGPTSVM